MNTWRTRLLHANILTVKILSALATELRTAGVVPAANVDRALFFDAAKLWAARDRLTERIAGLLLKKLEYLTYWPTSATEADRQWLITAGTIMASQVPQPPLILSTPLVAASLTTVVPQDKVSCHVEWQADGNGSCELRVLNAAGAWHSDGKVVRLADAERLLSGVAEILPQMPIQGTVANWQLRVTYANGHVAEYLGGVPKTVPQALVDLSDDLRDAFEVGEWALFDAPLSEAPLAFTIAYTEDDIDDEGVDYYEQLTADCLTGQVGLTVQVVGEAQEMLHGCTVATHQAQVDPAELLEHLEAIKWRQLPEVWVGEATVTVTTRNHQLAGSIDRDHLPEKWWVLAGYIRHLFGDCVLGSNDLAPRGETIVQIDDEDDEQAGVLVVTVVFTEGGKPYDYLAGDTHPAVGDEVVVPVGQAGYKKHVLVIGVRRVPEKKLPKDFKLKTVIEID